MNQPEIAEEPIKISSKSIIWTAETAPDQTCDNYEHPGKIGQDLHALMRDNSLLDLTKYGLDQRSSVFFCAVSMTRMPMVLTDPNQPDNPIVFANHAFEAFTGYEQSEIIGRNCRFLQGPQSDQGEVEELRRALQDRRAVSVELLNYRKDGTLFWNAVYIAPVFDENGALVFFFASQLDVTRRHKSEQAYREAQREKMASVGQLTAGVAHDFNNLLQVMIGNMEILRGHLVDDRLHRYLDNAVSAAERGARLTRQLLAFASKARLEPALLDLNMLLNDCSEILESTVGSKVELLISLRRRLPLTMVDAEYLERAVTNVVVNARDAMPEGGTITVSTSLLHLDVDAGHRSLLAGTYVMLSIVDTGEGMSDATLQKAIEPFFTTKPISKGTGLGLAMVHGFVQQSGGQLEIDSQVGRGTTVRMIFPAASDSVAIRHQAAPPTGQRADPRGASQTILVVEDNEDVLVLAREFLVDLGYRTLTAQNGEEALALLEGRNADGIDLLFTDVVMPGGIDGLMLADRVSAHWPELPVLFATGYNEELASNNDGSVARDVLSKPYTRGALADRVCAALKRNSATGKEDVLAGPSYQGPRHEG